MNIQIVKPQAGPQAAFIQCTADVVCYGGACGGGKSWAIALDFWLHAERHGEDARGLILRKTQNRAHALRIGQVGAAVQATAMKAKLFGFMIDRQQVQVEHTLRKPSADENAPAEMSLEDWQAKYGGSSPGLAISGNGKLIEHER